MKVHPSAILEGEIDLAPGVEIGPYCYLQGKVRIGAGTRLEGGVFIGSRYGVVEIGENNFISNGAAIGGPPQDLSYKNQVTRLKVGNNNVIREFCTFSLATLKADGETTIGNDGYFMAYVHIGHDCKIGNSVVIANNSHLGGHTIIEDHVNIGGVCAFNQFTRVGKFAFLGGGSVVNKDILPFTRAQGHHAVCKATNKIGLLRKGVSQGDVDNLHKAVRIFLLGSDTVEEAIARVQMDCFSSPYVTELIEFVRKSERGIAR